MGIENPDGKRREVKQVTKEDHDNALRYAEVQEEGNRHNEIFDRKQSWMTRESILENLENPNSVAYEHRGDYEHLKFAPLELRADKELMLKVVASYPYALEYVSPELQNDQDIVHTVTKNDARAAMKFASGRMNTLLDVRHAYEQQQAERDRNPEPVHGFPSSKKT